MKKTLKQKIDDALSSYRLQSGGNYNDQLAKELSAVSQCIEAGILDENGHNTERTKQLIRDYHDRS